MPFPSSPTPGDSYTDAYGTVWVYAGSVNGWYRQQVIPGNETTYTGGGSGSATATGAAGEIQFTDGTNLAASPNLLWDDANDELEVTGDLKLLDGGNHTTTLQTITPTQNNTISLPNATGTLALVAGSSGQLLYNNAGANAGVSTFTADSSGRLTNSASSASGFPVKLWNGTIFAGTTPHVLVQPTGATTPTSTNAWSANGTTLAVNTAAGFSGNLLDLQVNGTRALSLSYDTSNTAALVSSGPTVLRFTLTNGTWNPLVIRTEGPATGSNGYYSWTSASNNPLGTQDLYLFRDAAGILAQRNGTNAQTFRVYGTESSSLANYVRASLSSSSTAVTLAAESAGTGAANVPINLTAKGTGTVKVNSVAEVAVSSTVAGLPAAPAVGMLTRVTDATAPAVGSTVVGGGSAAALVWYNGTNWTVIGV